MVFENAEVRDAFNDGDKYVAILDVLKELLFLRQVWRFMLQEVGMPYISVLEDNEGAIQLARYPITNSNSKHIDVRNHFIRDLIARKKISITHVASEYQHADFLAKALSNESFELDRDFLTNSRTLDDFGILVYCFS